jgi:molybdenum cofactor guanylyltransferase
LVKHTKHPPLPRPDLGNFGRYEWAFMGTNCGVIQDLCRKIAQNTRPQYKIGYVDADHRSGDEGVSLSPFAAVYTDKIGFHELHFEGNLTHFQQRTLFGAADVVLVNGNHFTAKRQIVVLDPKKKESLSRKLGKLTQVDAFLVLGDSQQATGDSDAGIYDFLKEHLPNWASFPVFNIAEIEKIADFLISQSPISNLQSLILVGGKSQRMGVDKSQLNYHGVPQRQFLANILRGVNVEPHYSIRAEQKGDFTENDHLIPDSFLDLGPMGAILSAFRANPNTAWLVVACDLPLLDARTLAFLIANRRPSAVATAFRSPESKEGFPEPVIAIYEPKAYPQMLQFLAQGISCPRKFLINSDTHLIDAPRSETLRNVNTPTEKAEILDLLISHQP